MYSCVSLSVWLFAFVFFYNYIIQKNNLLFTCLHSRIFHISILFIDLLAVLPLPAVYSFTIHCFCLSMQRSVFFSFILYSPEKKRFLFTVQHNLLDQCWQFLDTFLLSSYRTSFSLFLFLLVLVFSLCCPSCRACSVTR